MKNQLICRRQFLRNSVLAFGGVVMLPSCLKDYSPFLFFTADEALILSDICEQIIPADENGPGATQAGVIYYIDKQLHEVFITDRDVYRNGLKALSESCRQLHNVEFDELEWDDQTNILLKMEKNELPGDYWQQHSAAGFFQTIIRHSMQGFYGPPRHGGNRDYISYKMIRLDYPYVVGRNHYK
jgi:gluconate 2-dehydrogenase gamma chain